MMKVQITRHWYLNLYLDPGFTGGKPVVSDSVSVICILTHPHWLYRREDINSLF